MQLQSNLSTLLEFDLNQLLAVQSDVTLLISRRVHELLNGCEKIGNDSKDKDKTCDAQTHRKAENIGDGFGNRKLDREEYDDDSEALILTQLDQKTRGKVETHENDDSVALRSVFPTADISSPLKESQSLPDSYEGTNLDSKASLMEPFEKDKLPSANNNTSIRDEDHYRFTKKICINKSISISSRANFNINPLTGKAWILEDFKRNENINYVKKAPIKIQKFVKNVSLESGTTFLMGGDVEQNDHDELYEFENLRGRCHSPPGYGRLDFPNTQERYDDKQKSQNLIFLKTKLRFCKATCNTIPPYEREFLFKNDKLNEIVDDGNFEWSDSELQIYMRK